MIVPCLIGLVMGITSACKVHKFPPELWKTTPQTGAIGQDVTLTGTQFGDTPSVTFTSTPQSGSLMMPGSATTVSAIVKTATDNAIIATIPRVPIGTAQIRVSNEEGITDPIAFKVLQPAPILTTLIPGNALPGATVRFTGDYLDQLISARIGVNSFFSGTTSLTTISAQAFEVTLPADAFRGPQTVDVVTTGGTATGTFIVSGTPEITSFTPKRIKAGTPVTITGKNLTDGVVTINGLATDKTQSSFTDTEIRTIVPATATSGKITVTVFAKLIATSADSLIIVGAPTLLPTALSITEGVKGDLITLAGTNLLDVSAVTFGDTPATFRVLSSTQLQVTVPDRTVPGAVPITITSLGGTATSTQSFLFILPPSGLTLSPTRQIRGQTVAIRGQNLNRITAVSINGRPATISGQTEGSEVQATVPADATTGLVSVTNRAATVSTALPLTVELAPTVTDFTRKATVGSRVVLKGTYLFNALIFFNGNNYPAVDDGNNQDSERWIVVTGDAQTGPIRVVNNAGETTTTESFTVLRPISSLDFTPKAAKVGSEITITGLNLADVTDIRFSGGKSAAATFRRSGATLIATVPVGAVDGTICLTNSTGTVCTTTAFNVQIPPSSLDFSPTKGKVGDAITLTGQNLADVTDVRFGGGKSGPAQFVVKTPTSLLITVPASATDGTICLTNPGGTVCTTASFNVLTLPANLAFSPTKGKVGDAITITGQNLADVTDIRFGGGKSGPAQFVIKSATSVLVTVPTGATDGTICLTNPAGMVCTTASFNVIMLPSGLDFTPDSAKAGTDITLTGLNLAEVTEVHFGAGKSSAAKFVVKSAGSLTVTVPADATDGTICVTNPVGTVCTTRRFNVMK